jgi:catechol 2,3-dioxygenase-like lactoylglutathione lyase family enzyme
MRPPRFKGPAAYVSDLSRSRAFYEEGLGLSVSRVMRRNEADIAIAYKEGISIWLVSDAYWSIFGEAAAPPARLSHDNWENTFETPDFAAIHVRLLAAGARFAYPLRELPWGQRGFRVRDPDGHIIDISETHGALIRRLAAGGMTVAAIEAQLGMEAAQIEACLADQD